MREELNRMALPDPPPLWLPRPSLRYLNDDVFSAAYVTKKGTSSGIALSSKKQSGYINKHSRNQQMEGPLSLRRG